MSDARTEDIICSRRWSYVIVDLGTGQIKTCHKTLDAFAPSAADIAQFGHELFLNNPHQRRRRAEMLAGVKHRSCQSCWDQQGIGITSFRQMFGEPQRFYRLQSTGLISRDNPVISRSPEYLEIILGDACDLKCIYCSAQRSRRWRAEDMAFSLPTHGAPKPPQGFHEHFLSWLDSCNVTKVPIVVITGGEPLLSPTLYELLDRFDNAETTVSVNSNLNAPPRLFERFLAAAPRCRAKVRLEVSNEAIEARSEYIRNGLKWSTFDANLTTSLSIQNAALDVGVLLTLNALAVPSLPAFIRYLNGKLTGKKVIKVRINRVEYPAFLNPAILTPDFAASIDVAAEDLVHQHVHCIDEADLNALKDLRKQLEDQSLPDLHQRRRDFAYFIDDNDRKRGSDFKRTFPELRPFYELCLAAQ